MPARFARLRIAGFKSFADPTVVEILPGLTGVVGPNGCGKSNVIEALFASQDDWAFQPNEDYHASIFKYAALAGMDQATFDTAWNDDKLAQFILNAQQEAEKMYKITATPTFIINGKTYPGAMEYDDFAATVAAAAKG